MDTEITKGGSAMETSVNGTRFDQRKSLDRGTTNMNSDNQDYGSVVSPNSPYKIGRGLANAMPRERGTDSKTFDNRRNTTKPVREASGNNFKRANSVIQNAPLEINT